MWGEMQTRYALGCIKAMLQHGWQAMDVRREVYDAHQTRLDEILSHSIWMDPSQRSYYRNDFGRVATNTPWGSVEYWNSTRTPNFDDFVMS